MRPSCLASHAPESRSEKKEQKHLRQPGDGVAPHHIGEQDQARRYPSDFGIEQPAHDEEKNEDGGEKKGNPCRGYDAITNVDDIGGLH